MIYNNNYFCATLHYKKVEGDVIKTLYLIRHAKSDWSNGELSDFERGLKKRGLSDLKAMGSYLALQNTKPDLILSSASLRTQLTADGLARKIKYTGPIQYMDELYITRPEMIINVLSLQEDKYKTIFLVGHNPSITELAKKFQTESFTKFPTLGILAINLEIDSWKDIGNAKGEIDFFIVPKQFRYYIPKQIRTILEEY